MLKSVFTEQPIVDKLLFSRCLLKLEGFSISGVLRRSLGYYELPGPGSIAYRFTSPNSVSVYHHKSLWV
jgi:hypothetical protein